MTYQIQPVGPGAIAWQNPIPMATGRKISYAIVLLAALLLLPFAGFSRSGHLDPDTLNRKAPDFRLLDLNGKTVSLSDFKGKVVVLDFWATWCIPCQQSFPAMKLAVEHFAKRNDVVFLFIDTQENLPDYKKLVEQWKQQNNYPFHVLFDETGPKGSLDKVFLAYDMPGIPTKFIIDGSGTIRFRLVGNDYRKTAPENAKKLIDLIESTKKMVK